MLEAPSSLLEELLSAVFGLTEIRQHRRPGFEIQLTEVGFLQFHLQLVIWFFAYTLVILSVGFVLGYLCRLAQGRSWSRTVSLPAGYKRV